MTFLRVFLLAATWCLLFGSFSPGKVAAGVILGAGLLILLRRRGVIEPTSTRVRPLALLRLAGVFARELVVSNFHVIAAIFAAKRPPTAIVAVPLEARTDAEITLFATIVTLTPGTLSMHVDEARTTLYVHVLLPPKDREHAVRDLKETFERRVLEALR
jgi:multicomponent Na+:H+ antiporter subunit E